MTKALSISIIRRQFVGKLRLFYLSFVIDLSIIGRYFVDPLLVVGRQFGVLITNLLFCRWSEVVYHIPWVGHGWGSALSS